MAHRQHPISIAGTTEREPDLRVSAKALIRISRENRLGLYWNPSRGQIAVLHTLDDPPTPREQCFGEYLVQGLRESRELAAEVEAVLKEEADLIGRGP